VADKAPKGLIADIGCGAGVMTAMLALDRLDRRVIGADPDERKLNLARLGLGRLPNVEFRRATVDDLTRDFREAFDSIVVADVLYLMPIEKWNDFLAACFQLLRPGGVLLLKEAVADGSWKYYKCLLQEAIMVKVLRKTQSSGGLNFMPREFMETLLVRNGFAINEFLDLSAGYSTPHVLWTAVRP
jgi:2-polyprenyl-6-hydroxyphenyl methylase/3-demethylubiquinone-9 3-methyltransferase